ncbi:MAG: AAA family ATPase [archaeon]|nr:AAA family ATPase [archaeon]
MKSLSNSNFNIDDYFDKYLKSPTLFINRNALDVTYIPDELPHRDIQIKEIAQITACTLKNGSPSNIFIYGKCGTGKTAVVKHVSKKLNDKCQQIGINRPKWLYINCKKVKTSYRVLANIYNKLDPSNPLPPTGIPVDIILERVISIMEKKVTNSICFIILDEIDSLKDKKSKDNILYILSRINENLEKCKVNLIGISNILNFKEDLDPRVCSSLCEEEIVFPAYNAVQLFDILKARVSEAFIENIIEEGALRLCAAIAAKENGDARRALSILRKSAEIIERRGLMQLTEEHVYIARDNLDRDKTAIFINNLPAQQKAILLSIFLNHKYKKGADSCTGEVYGTYCELLKKVYGLNTLTQRRTTDLVKELDLVGITSSRLKSFGKKGGRTRMISLKVSENQITKNLRDDSRWSEYLNYIPYHLRRNDINLYSGQKYKSLI